MVEISKSGSGEGRGWATGPGYSTLGALQQSDPAAEREPHASGFCTLQGLVEQVTGPAAEHEP